MSHAPTHTPGTDHEPSLGNSHGDPQPSHAVHVHSLFAVYFWLMALLVATVCAALFIHAGELNIVLAMTIAVTKAAMVIWIFMHVKFGGKLVWVFASAAFVWLGILLALTFNDYFTREQLPRGRMYNMDSPLVHSIDRTGASVPTEVKSQ